MIRPMWWTFRLWLRGTFAGPGALLGIEAQHAAYSGRIPEASSSRVLFKMLGFPSA